MFPTPCILAHPNPASFHHAIAHAAQGGLQRIRYPLDDLWKTCVLEFCGVKVVHRQMFCVVVTSSEEQRRAWLRQVKDVVAVLFPDH